MQLHLSMQPQMPDLAGQPAWVQVVVAALFAAAWFGSRWITRGRDAEDDEDEPASATRPLPAEGVTSAPAVSADHQSTAVIMRTLELLHQEAQESRDGREDAARWRDKVNDLQRRLDECQDELGQRAEGSER
jgi:small-conductance mechanosensitive channel